MDGLPLSVTHAFLDPREIQNMLSSRPGNADIFSFSLWCSNNNNTDWDNNAAKVEHLDLSLVYIATFNTEMCFSVNAVCDILYVIHVAGNLNNLSLEPLSCYYEWHLCEMFSVEAKNWNALEII